MYDAARVGSRRAPLRRRPSGDRVACVLAVVPYHLGAFFARRLPRPAARAVADAIGRANARARRETVRVVAHNLRVIAPALSPDEAREQAPAVIRNFAQAIRVFLELPFLEWERERRRFDLSELDAALASIQARPGPGARPIVMASAHLGPWELGGWVLARLGFRVLTIALDHPSRSVSRFFSDRRRRVGVEAVAPRGAVARLSAALGPGACVALLVDRDVGAGGLEAPWFGRRAVLPTGHAVVAVRTGAPVVVGALVFDGDDGYRYVHGGVHDPASYAGSDAERVAALHRDCAGDLERLVARHPLQWFHFRPLGGHP